MADAGRRNGRTEDWALASVSCGGKNEDFGASYRLQQGLVVEQTQILLGGKTDDSGKNVIYDAVKGFDRRYSDGFILYGEEQDAAVQYGKGVPVCVKAAGVFGRVLRRGIFKKITGKAAARYRACLV